MVIHNQTNRKEIGKEKINITHRVTKESYEKFKGALRSIGLNVSGWLDEMMPLVVNTIEKGGEAVFGFELDKKNIYVENKKGGVK